jgi:hypothetical protein
MIMATDRCKLIPISDKESYAYIRLKTPGESIVKMFRKAFNKVFRQSVSSKIRQIVLENPNFTSISMETILEGVNAEDIDKVLKRTINTGTEKIKLK